jgi:hypothetical protein
MAGEAWNEETEPTVGRAAADQWPVLGKEDESALVCIDDAAFEHDRMLVRPE